MSKSSILIVENEAIVAADLANKLKRLGYEVAGIAMGGEEALTFADDLRPQLILMDIRLDGPMDGIEAAELIRGRHDIPVVYLTAYSDSATVARAKLTGPFGYILKPFEEQDLATQIELALYKHQADREVRRQRELMRVTLTSIGDAVIATDAEGRITFINPVAESLTGWKGEDASGKPIPSVFRIINERAGEVLEEPVARVLREGRAVVLANHTALVNRDGRTVPIEDSAAPILDAEGKVIGAVLVFHDVTEKRRAAEELRRSRDELALRVRERTAELENTNTELRESYRRLEELNKELQEFSFVASHDLREPLRKIRTFGDMLVAKSGAILEEGSKDYLKRMQRAVARMQDLLNSLLGYSRVSTKMEPLRETDLGRSVKTALSNLEIMIKEKNARIEIDELPTIIVDRVQMVQLFQNMIENALKFNREDEPPHVKIYGKANHESETCEICVEDNGIGFDEMYLDKLFVPFQKLHGRDSVYDGMGMGLAICRKIVKRHGGEITARSKLGQGTTFIVTLPLETKGQ
ncbi:MAG: response regulator [Deltaproteobacteria bacterium]|nr:response regulator [Deltaproteobacteria bacterium]